MEKSEIHLINFPWKDTREEYLNKLVKEVSKISKKKYAGYKNVDELKENLNWQMFGEQNQDKKVSFNKSEILKIIKTTLKKCLERVNRKISIFVFPSYNKFTNKKMGGVAGNFSNRETVVIFVNTSSRNWEKNLKQTLAHEFSHAVSNYYDPWENTLGEGIVLDGIAENFQEEILGKVDSLFSKILTPKEYEKIFFEIKDKLNSKDEKIYNEVFYGEGKYKLWTGYALGYILIKEYIKSRNKINWKEIINLNPKEILKTKFSHI